MVKTAGSFLQDYFGHYVPGSRGTGLGARKHRPVRHVRDASCFKFGVCRNPYSWYVSWWAFVANQRRPGNSFPTITSPDFHKTLDLLNKATGIVKQTSSRMFIDFDFLRRHDIGIMTWKFIETFCDYDRIIAEDAFDGFTLDLILVDRFARMELLPQDLIDMFDTFIFKLSTAQKEGLLSMERKNVSKHDYFRKYYNQPQIDWVTHKERHLIDLFGYTWSLDTCGQLLTDWPISSSKAGRDQSSKSALGAQQGS